MTRHDALLGMIDSILVQISSMPSFSMAELSSSMDAVRKIVDIINELDALDLYEEIAGQK